MADHICKIGVYLLQDSRVKYRCDVCDKFFKDYDAQTKVIRDFGEDKWHDEWDRLKEIKFDASIKHKNGGFLFGIYPIKIS